MAGDSTGRRAVQPSYLTPDGVVGGRANNQPGDGTVQQTTHVTTPIKRLTAGDSIN